MGRQKNAESPSRPRINDPPGMLQAMRSGSGQRPAKVWITGIRARPQPAQTPRVATHEAARERPSKMAAAPEHNRRMQPEMNSSMEGPS
ncbi:MAG TPA: hypothetical protein VLI39_20850 [Sedimentisphaerales bacterium]|nr:hypothetical protein [Sedimentisphaerales bacterium]